MRLLEALLAAAVLAVLHLVAGRLAFLDRVPRSRWLSAAGGVSVAYVFVHLLPELARAQEAVGGAVDDVVALLEDHVYLLALVGLSVFYGLERAAKRSRQETRGQEAHARVAAIALGTYALYNGLIGYLLTQPRDGGARERTMFAVAMGVHFIVNDHGLREHFRSTYHRVGRWVLAAAVLGGWAVGALLELPEAAIGMLLAFLAGGVILNVLKEELPEERESRFSAFAAGALGYTVLLLAV